MADIIRKTSTLPNNTGFLRVYYVNEKEVYRETLDKHLDIQSYSGTLPDGTVKEFFENGKPYFESEVKNEQRNGICKIYFDI